MSSYPSSAFEAQPRCAQMLRKLGKGFSARLPGGREVRRQGGGFTWFQVSGQKNFFRSNSSQLQDPLDSIGNPKSRVCVQDRLCQAEEWDFRQLWGTGRCTCQCAGCALLEACGKHSPRLGHLFPLGLGRGGKAFEATAAWQWFPFWGKGTIWHVARAVFPSVAHSWPHLAPAAWEAPAPQGAPAAGAALPEGTLPMGEPPKELHQSLGAAKMRPRLKSRALIKLMACLACNLGSWASTSLWSNRFT